MTTRVQEGLHSSVVEHGGVRELFLTAALETGADLEAEHFRVRQTLEDLEAELLEVRVFGAVDAFDASIEILRELYGDPGWPLVHIQGRGCGKGEMAGIQVHAVAGVPVETIRSEGRPVGRTFEDRWARYCVLGGLQSSDPSRSREQQTQDTLEQMMSGLADCGMDLHCVVRTWFFIDRILDWYQAFNGARSEVYSREGLFGRYVPASTGIAGANPAGTAVVASALGIQAKGGEGGEASFREIPSPLQCPALSYGSSFSRASELVTPGLRRVFVSGTASIDADGNTVHRDDIDRQIDHTLEVVGAILDSRGMGFQDVTRGNAYFKARDHAPRLVPHAEGHGLPLSSLVVSQNEVCREDLLFELEVDAVTGGEETDSDASRRTGG